jgi:subtilisin family serine protease
MRGALARARVTSSRGGATALTAACVLSVGVAGLAAPAALASSATSSPARRAAAPIEHQVTLITGDVVRVSTSADGRSTVALDPRPDGSMPQAAITQDHGHVFVVPTEAFGLLAKNRLDRDLFDVTGLVDAEYDDASTDDIPVIVDYGSGRPAAAEARSASVAAATRSVTIPRLGLAAFDADKDRARRFWSDLTAGEGPTGPTRLSDGAARVDLDGRVEVALEDSVPQIHAPETWAAGYNGAGTTVAVLDTGYDPTHPDLQDKVAESENFTPDATIVDGNGHGTHVASTVAGSGAASDGLRKGVAPGATLMVGKVLADEGYGEDSWVLAGMVWAVNHGADVVSMSLGGDPDDGSHPLSQAVNELSASSDTLFVIAAGNSGPDASTVSSPGSAQDALTVGAVDDDDAMAYFSSRGPLVRSGGLKPEVSGPGVDIVAARSAGTTLGTPLNDLYTSMSGTSMATPHVAGLAAILKQEHPGWDGEQLKAAIANSTVPVSGARAFDTGTGRIDALKAIHAEVLAPATKSLGTFAWPYSDLGPGSTPVTYTNLTDAPVTLDLALAGEDGTPVQDGSMALASDQLVVPAQGSASVDVVLDPTIAGPGSYSAVVTATRADNQQTVRTAVGYLLEPEMYDLTIRVVPRAGSQAVSHQVGLSSYGPPWLFEQRNFDATAGEVTAKFRVPPGTYATGDIGFGLAADGAREGVVTYDPQIQVDSDTEVLLDENATGRFAYQVDRPVVDDGAILDVGWNTDAGYTGYLLYGAADRVYARPSAGLGGHANIATNWLLSEPEGTLRPPGGAPIGLRPVPAPGDSAAWTSVPALDGTFSVADAGTASAPRTAGLRGAVALVAGACEDLGPAASALKQAGAAALIAYPAAGATCAGTVPTDTTLPSLQIRPWQAPALLEQRGKVRIQTRSHPGYMYDLVRHYPDEVPDGAVVRGTGSSVAAVVEHYRGLGTTSKDGFEALEELVAWVPSRDGAANVGLVRPVPFPSTVTHYLSTGAAWERKVSILDATYGGEYANMYAPRRVFPGGTTSQDTWFGGPVGSRVSPLQQLTNGAPPPVREDGWIYLSQGAWTDSAGHLTNSDLFTPEYSGEIWVDGDLRYATDWSVFMNTDIPAGDHHVDVKTHAYRKNPFWQLSTDVTTQWSFESEEPTGARSVLPMLGVDYRMKLSDTGSAPAGRYTFDIAFQMPDTLPTRPVVERSVQVSWDHGETWQNVALDKCGGSSCEVAVRNVAGHTASLRVRATDDLGRSVRQTIVDAYRVQ